MESSRPEHSLYVENTLSRIVADLARLLEVQQQTRVYVEAIQTEQVTLKQAVGDVRKDLAGISAITTDGVGLAAETHSSKHRGHDVATANVSGSLPLSSNDSNPLGRMIGKRPTKVVGFVPSEGNEKKTSASEKERGRSKDMEMGNGNDVMPDSMAVSERTDNFVYESQCESERTLVRSKSIKLTFNTFGMSMLGGLGNKPNASSRPNLATFHGMARGMSKLLNAQDEPQSAQDEDSASEDDEGGFEKAGGMTVELHPSWEQATTQAPKRFGDMQLNVFASSTFKDVDRKAINGNIAQQQEACLQRLVLSPSSDVLLVWSIIEGMLLTYDMITTPIFLVYASDTRFDHFMKWFALCFWTLDMPLCGLKGYITKNGDVQLQLRKVVRKYLKTGFALDIVLLVVEWINFMAWRNDGDTDAHSSTRSASNLSRFISRSLRFSRLLKVGKLRRLHRRLLAQVKSAEKLFMISSFGQLFMLVMMCHLVACLWYYVGCGAAADQIPGSPCHQGLMGETLLRWVDELDVRDERTFGELYLVALQWSLSQLGFGASIVYPVNMLERLFAAVFGVMCLSGVSLWVASVVAGMIRIQSLNRDMRLHSEKMRDYLRERDVSWALRNRIWKVVKVSIEGKSYVHEDDVELIQVLPENMVLELRAEALIPILTVYPFFGNYGISKADKHAMNNIIRKRVVYDKSIDSEHELFGEHDIGEAMYFLARGSLDYRWKRTTETICMKGCWLGEASLWLQWSHVGQAMTRMQSELVVLDAGGFRDNVQKDLPEARRYAKAFLLYATRNKRRMNDIKPEIHSVSAMATDVFEAPRFFDVLKCRPVKSRGVSEWQPTDKTEWHTLWVTPWSDSNLLCSSALLSTMTADMKHDVVLVYQTLFAQNSVDRAPFQWLSNVEKDLYDRRVMFLKRMILCCAVCGVMFTDKDNDTATRPWPFPLASMICHGSRALVHLDGIPWRKFCNFLIFGDQERWNWDTDGVPDPLYVRRAATHGVVLDDASMQLREVKLKGLNTLGSGHMGMDLPIGGLANPTPMQKCQSYVGPAGVPFQQRAWPSQGEPKYIKDRQHGHMYIRADDFGVKQVRRLVAMEAGSDRGDESSNLGCHDGRGRQVLASQKSASAESSSTNTDVWRPLQHTIQAIEHLEKMLQSKDHTELLNDSKRVAALYHYIAGADELTIETNVVSVVGELRCQGSLVFLAIEFEEDGIDKVFVQTTAHTSDVDYETLSTTSRSKQRTSKHWGKQPEGFALHSPQNADDADLLDNLADDEKSLHFDEMRIITVICRHTESWLSALSRYCRDVLRLAESAIARLVDACTEDAEIFQCAPASSVCYHHEHACGSQLSLGYQGLRLRARLHEKDRHSFERLLGSECITTEKVGMVHNGHEAIYFTRWRHVTREWKWIPKTEAVELGVQYVEPPEMAERMQLKRETRHIQSLLIGIENSAPLKTDMFGHTHTPDAKSKVLSAFGKRKWKDYRAGGQKVPADLGGMHLWMDEQGFQRLQGVCDALDLCTPHENFVAGQDSASEKDFFQQILCSCDGMIDQLLRDRLNIDRSQAR